MDSYSARTLTATLVILASAAVIVHAWSTAGAEQPSSGSRSRKSKNRASKNADMEPQYVTGLVNIGNTCFMNSVLQHTSVAEKNLDTTRTRSPWHYARRLSVLLTAIHRRPTSRRPVKMVNTVKAKAAQVLTSQQQDAQELFQILSSQLSEEREKVDHPTTSSLLDRMTVSEILNPSLNRRQSTSSVMSASLSSISSLSLSSPSSAANRSKSISSNTGQSSPQSPPPRSTQEDKEKDSNRFMTASLIVDKKELEKYNRAKSPFMGLLASRVSCVDCGYTAAIRHSTFDNLSLTVPPQLLCTLENCLDAFIHLDTINDFNCRKCTLLNSSRELGMSIVQLHNSLALTPDTYAEGQDTTATSVAKPVDIAQRVRLSQLEQTKAKIDECLATNIEMDLSPLELTQVRSKKTTKHSMIAKPPQALCLHLNRSMFTPSGQLAKNPCKVVFQPVLDFTPFTTSGYLNTVATKSMSRRGSLSLAETFASSSSSMDTGESFSKSLSKPTWANPGMPTKDGTTLFKNGHLNGSYPTEQYEDRILYRLRAVVVHLGSHNSGHFVTYRRIPSVSSPSGQTSMVDESKSKWWRISDEDVQVVTWDTVKHMEAYMLFYEKETSTKI
ncbi:hypothetical protein CPB97_000941 [Podila verticillata]|nr:hypothetical protein CPB97_000941 [Podila verticillata]